MITKYDVASIAATNNLEGDDYHKLTSAQQREIFGANIIGRKGINFESDGQGVVRILSSKAFGTDCSVLRMTYDQFAQCVNNQEKIEV